MAHADHAPDCPPGPDPAIGLVMLSAAGSVFYVEDHRGDLEIHEESNGIHVDGDPHASLQRDHSASPYLPNDPDLCVEDPIVIPDTKLFDSGWV